mmetsp:Transcript_33189/g.79460  ORF Transcript_33189/g.79460 Transcript_33189/m.79460 type:complete len:206 (+) Transcript_33189:84-701(+)
MPATSGDVTASPGYMYSQVGSSSSSRSSMGRCFESSSSLSSLAPRVDSTAASTTRSSSAGCNAHSIQLLASLGASESAASDAPWSDGSVVTVRPITCFAVLTAVGLWSWCEGIAGRGSGAGVVKDSLPRSPGVLLTSATLAVWSATRGSRSCDPSPCSFIGSSVTEGMPVGMTAASACVVDTVPSPVTHGFSTTGALSFMLLEPR